MTIPMADSAESPALPDGLPAYASYTGGHIGDQPNYARVVAAHPGAHHLSIALSASDDADCLDVENGAASPSDVPGWVKRQHARGITRPVVYASASPMKTAILPLLQAAGIGLASVRLWTAHYGEGEHICGPATCRALSVNADGTQWTDAFHGPNGVVDMSLLADDFFGPAAPPANWIFSPPRGLAAKPGHTNVELTWDAPSGPAPEAVHHYQVTIRHLGEDVASYPRDVPKGANPEVHDFGSLAQGTAYEAMTRAVAVNGHASTWAVADFTTGRG